MNILIAYDGSDSSAHVLDDLALAGLPEDASCLVLTVIEYWNALPHSYVEGINLSSPDEAGEANSKGVEAVAQLFPGWKVEGRLERGSPAGTILEVIEEWGADLVVVGSQNLSTVERIIFGSLSHTILTHAPCSVRIARPQPDRPVMPVRLMLAYDGSANSEKAFEQLCIRKWVEGTEIVIVSGTHIYLEEAAGEREEAYYREEHQRLTGKLNECGYQTTSIIYPANPKYFILEQARARGIDAIFLGAVGHSAFRRLLLGSVSTAIASRADCSVEVVR